MEKFDWYKYYLESIQTERIKINNEYSVNVEIVPKCDWMDYSQIFDLYYCSNAILILTGDMELCTDMECALTSMDMESINSKLRDYNLSHLIGGYDFALNRVEIEKELTKLGYTWKDAFGFEK